MPTAVILLNLGGPDRLDAVRPFLYNLFSDRMIIRLGPAFLQKPIAWWIAKRRAPKSESYYRQIGGGSPIAEITANQAAALETLLRQHGDYRVIVGMRYWEPYIDKAVKQALDMGADKIISLSLYPQYSLATTGSSEDKLIECLSAHKNIEHLAVKPWYQHPKYIETMASLIMQKYKDNMPILFSAHSLPQSLIDDGDPYVDHTLATIKAIMAHIKTSHSIEPDWTLGYQSRSGPVKWLEPSTEQVITDTATAGHKDALIVPISFVSDHIETLYEIDILYKQMAAKLGLTLHRPDAMNLNNLFIEALQDMVLTADSKAA